MKKFRNDKSNHYSNVTSLSLDIGAGDVPRGDINIDVRRLNNIDVVCHALYLPFRDDTFTHIYLSHVVEHFNYKDVIVLLKEVKRILKGGGKVEIWIPNFMAFGVLEKWITGSIEKKKLPILYGLLTGGYEYNEDVHLSQWNIQLLKTYVTSQNFKIIYVKGEMEFKGKTSLILNAIKKLLVRTFPSRSGAIHLVAEKLDV
jgi:ubiquinone/menaquinone biosynthesis C-methylase UbiE